MDFKLPIIYICKLKLHKRMKRYMLHTSGLDCSQSLKQIVISYGTSSFHHLYATVYIINGKNTELKFNLNLEYLKLFILNL